MHIQDATDEQLLAELIRRNGHSQGPTKTEYASTIREALVGIGPDNTATIRLHSDDLEALKSLGAVPVEFGLVA